MSDRHSRRRTSEGARTSARGLGDGGAPRVTRASPRSPVKKDEVAFDISVPFEEAPPLDSQLFYGLSPSRGPSEGEPGLAGAGRGWPG